MTTEDEAGFAPSPVKEKEREEEEEEEKEAPRPMTIEEVKALPEAFTPARQRARKKSKPAKKVERRSLTPKKGKAEALDERVRKMAKAGKTQRQIAKALGVCQSHVSRAVNFHRPPKLPYRKRKWFAGTKWAKASKK